MTPTTQRRLTAAQVILLAGDDLANGGAAEFSEWELTVAAWTRDRVRFGLRGYQQNHPDHKRVMMEIMGQKPHNPIHLKLMEKLRPNYYRLTPHGRAEATRLREKPPETAAPSVATPIESAAVKASAKGSSDEGFYEALSAYALHPTFVAWKDDPEEPQEWSDAAAFFGARRGKASDYVERATEIEKAARAALDYCVTEDLDFLAPTGKNAGKKIPLKDLADLGNFLKAMTYRFEDHLDAGRKLVPAKV